MTKKRKAVTLALVNNKGGVGKTTTFNHTDHKTHRNH